MLPSGRIHFMRTDVKPGMQTAADVIKGENIVVGGLGRDGPKDLAMRLTLDMLGANYKYVTGYNSSAQAMIALQRGEISYYADSPPLYKTKIEPQVKAGALLPVFYDPEFDGKRLQRAELHEELRHDAVPRALQVASKARCRRASCGRRTSRSSWSTAPCTG